MSIVNEAYRVLSDPELRNEHDRWLTLTESQFQQTVTNPPPSSKPADVPASPNGRPVTEAALVGDDVIDLEKTYESFVRTGLLVAIALIIIVLVVVVAASR